MSAFFPDNQTGNADELRVFIDDMMADFMGTPTQRDTTAFVADDGDLVEVKLSPLEEFVINAGLYGVTCALMMLPDGQNRNPFASNGRNLLRAANEYDDE